MKNLTSLRTRVLGVALLTAFAGAPFLSTVTAQAAPKDRRDDRRRDDRGDDRRDTGRDASYTGTVTNVRSGNSFDLNVGGRTYNVYTNSSLPRGLSRGDRVSVSGRSFGDNDVRGASVSILDNNRNDSRRDDNRGGNNGYGDYRNYDGTVEILLPGNEFNARIGGRIYKVYATESTRDLRVGDPIRIYGQLDRDVNIRNARITRNGNGRTNDNRPDYSRDRDGNWRYDPNGKIGDRRPDYNRPDYGNQRDFNTYTGEVTDVKNDREFRVRIGGRDYDVYAGNSTRDVRRGDTVSVYGYRFGDNDIRDARVTVTRDRYNEDRGTNDYGPYRTYTGIVTDVKNSREFDVRIDGRIYNVYADNSTRDLNRGDEVRIYGRSFGDNDLRNANVRITRDR